MTGMSFIAWLVTFAIFMLGTLAWNLVCDPEEKVSYFLPVGMFLTACTIYSLAYKLLEWTV